jgi:hypothetical protein
MQHRRDDLEAADAAVASAEVIPKIVLLFILLVLPFLVSPAPFGSLGDFLWWARAWAPVWGAMVVVLYLPAVLALAPAQLTGATVEAMTQTEDGREPVAWREPVVEECVLAAPFLQVDEQITCVRARFCQWRILPHRRKRYPTSAVDCAQSTGETAATDNRRPYSTCVISSFDPFLADNSSHYSTRHSIALAS